MRTVRRQTEVVVDVDGKQFVCSGFFVGFMIGTKVLTSTWCR
jgi:hypothetical protein